LGTQAPAYCLTEELTELLLVFTIGLVPQLISPIKRPEATRSECALVNADGMAWWHRSQFAEGSKITGQMERKVTCDVFFA
jgi:hypothetical protein